MITVGTDSTQQRPSSGQSVHKHCQCLETFDVPSKVFNERTFDKSDATQEYDELFFGMS